ncbi:hypothetical protein [Emticicia agri]|uniref:DUF1574 domain-containing protein n=1 Tax=Emticicia agri TaxID=2492393 RepID=A0A4Q5LUZ2_9BACT|nr:hypothetical protein [Emticicia agri]RYU93526.1 hypothetical protein EWM59_21715 [Emticicia agri]
MTGIKKFFYKVLLFGAIIIVSVWLLNIVFIAQTSPYEYLGGMLNDKHKMVSQIQSPKVLWVGGSSGSFGINSDTLQKHLGMPVFNLSFIAPLGTYFLLNDALKEVKKGDKVFVSTEYDIEKYSTPPVIYSAIDYYPAGAIYVARDTTTVDYIGHRVKHKLANIKKLFWNVFTKNEAAVAAVEDKTSVYFRSAFSAKGDIISHVNNTPKQVDFFLFPKAPIDYQEQIDDLNHFVAEVRKKGGEVYYVFPPLAESTYQYGKVAVESVEKQLKANLKCDILGSAKDFVRKDSSFFDSFYHLKPFARDLNTQKIIELYKEKQK